MAKVLIAPVHIGGQLLRYERCSKKIGIKASSMALYDNKFGDFASINLSLNKQSNPCLSLMKRFYYFIYFLFNFEIFHFFFGETLLPNNWDLPILKLLKKKLLMNYWGSDIRLPPVIKKKSKYYVNSYKESARKNIAKMKRVSKYIQNVAVQDYELYEYVLPYFKNIYILRSTVEESEINFDIFNNMHKIIITHIPSQKEFKGSEIIEDVMIQLKKKYENLIYNTIVDIPINEVKPRIIGSHLIIDQIRVGAHGIISVEAFSLGRPVICYIRDDLLKYYPKELPIINANPENLNKIIEKILKKPEILKEYAKKSYNYYKKYHSPEVIGKQLMNIYKKL